MSYGPNENQNYYPPPPTPMNGKSIAGFVLGVLSIIVPYRIFVRDCSGYSVCPIP